MTKRPNQTQSQIFEGIQARRFAAMEAGDWDAYAAFDLLIGHMLYADDMYVKHNRVLQDYKEAEEV